MRASTSPIVLVHGAWHGAWCFAALQAELDRRGLASYAIDLPGHGSSTLPLGDLHGDAAYLVDVLDRLGEPAILAGHSYGGAVITEAAAQHPAVAHLVYLTAFALDAGESVMGLLRSLPPAPVTLSRAMQQHADGTSTLVGDALIVEALYARCDPQAAAAAIPRLSPQPAATMVQPVSGTPRDTVASTYVRCTLDQAVDISHQDHMAARCTTVHTLDTDHSPFLSVPSETADIIARIARG